MTARTGPPAMTPVPAGAGFNNTRPLPNRPSTGCWMVVASTCTRRKFFLAGSKPFLMAAGTFFALVVVGDSAAQVVGFGSRKAKEGPAGIKEGRGAGNKNFRRRQMRVTT